MITYLFGTPPDKYDYLISLMNISTVHWSTLLSSAPWRYITILGELFNYYGLHTNTHIDRHYKASGAGVNAAESFCPVDCLSTEREGLLSLGQLSQPPFCLTLPIWGKLIPDLLPPRLMTRTTRTNLDIQWAKWLFPLAVSKPEDSSKRPKTNESIPEKKVV